MVLRETQRAFVYFSLHGLTVDGIIVNRVLPERDHRHLVRSVARLASQDSGRNRRIFRAGAHEARAAVHARSAGPRAPDRTGRRAVRRRRKIRPRSRAPKRRTPSRSVNSHYEVRLRLPFAVKGEVGLFKKGDELVVEIGTLRRHIGLPTSMAALTPTRATLQNKMLTVEIERRLIWTKNKPLLTCEHMAALFLQRRRAADRGASWITCGRENTREHFRNARIEMLKGMRSMLDARIEHLSQARRRRAPRSRSNSARSAQAEPAIHRQHLAR